jgi:Na+/melibiose symporter-like transporter
MIAGLLLMLAAIGLLAVATHRPAERYRLTPRRRRQARGAGALLLALSFAAAMLAGGGLLAFIEWVLAFGLLMPIVALSFTAHAKRR